MSCGCQAKIGEAGPQAAPACASVLIYLTDFPALGRAERRRFID
jgi:hypothetical protein